MIVPIGLIWLNSGFLSRLYRKDLIRLPTFAKTIHLRNWDGATIGIPVGLERLTSGFLASFPVLPGSLCRSFGNTVIKPVLESSTPIPGKILIYVLIR